MSCMLNEVILIQRSAEELGHLGWGQSGAEVLHTSVCSPVTMTRISRTQMSSKVSLMYFCFMLLSFVSASLAAIFFVISPLKKGGDEPEEFNSAKFTQI